MERWGKRGEDFREETREMRERSVIRSGTKMKSAKGWKEGGGAFFLFFLFCSLFLERLRTVPPKLRQTAAAQS